SARGHEHVPRPGEDLPGDEERHQHLGSAREVGPASDQVVLVAAVGVARRVEVVLEQVDAPLDAVGLQPRLRVLGEPDEDALARLVVRDELREVVALRGRVLRVRPHVEVEPGPVGEEDVAGAPPGDDLAEQVARHLLRGEAAPLGRGAGDPELGLEPEDPPDHDAGPLSSPASAPASVSVPALPSSPWSSSSSSVASSSASASASRRRNARRVRVRSSTAASSAAGSIARTVPSSAVPSTVTASRTASGSDSPGRQASATSRPSRSASPPMTTCPGSSVTDPS